MSRAKVLLVDDHALVRAGIKAMLAEQPDMEVVAEASTLAQARELIQQTRPDVILLDIQLREGKGTELFTTIQHDTPKAAVIILSSHLSATLVRECMTNGVAGYLVKDTEDLDLTSAIRIVLHGGTVFDPRVIGLEGQATKDQLQSISPREMQVLGYVCMGLTNAEIALKLTVSENTIKGYVSSVMRKLACDNRVKLVLKAKEMNLV